MLHPNTHSTKQLYDKVTGRSIDQQSRRQSMEADYYFDQRELFCNVMAKCLWFYVFNDVINILVNTLEANLFGSIVYFVLGPTSDLFWVAPIQI